MYDADDLSRLLRQIDGRGYRTYGDIQKAYRFDSYTLFVDHVQSDPFAPPSKVRVRVPLERASFPDDLYANKSRDTALRDFLTREFSKASARFCKRDRGTGNGGVISIDRPGQEVLERSSAHITKQFVEARFVMGLPAFGRSVAGRHAEAMFFEELPRIVHGSLFAGSLNMSALRRHIATVEDADFVRRQLDGMGLVAFVADGSVLPRASGVDRRPLTEGHVVPFESPESLRVQMDLPNRGTATGLGIPTGVTLIVGGGYHGKSTLLRALELGVYNHVPGDGRELVIANPQTVKIRSEDGRRIEKVDISPFISGLPFGQDTTAFSTDDASGSTSQAANIIESLELGAQVLLIDEDTSATNFMIRDHRMQELVSKEKEPITPFIDKVRQLYRDKGVSTILVIGGSGDYFDVADRVVCMVEYHPQDVTERSQAIAETYAAERRSEGGREFGTVGHRIPLGHSLDPSKGRREVKISPKGLHSIAFGTQTIDLAAVEQLVDASQTRAIGDALHYASKRMDGEGTLRQILEGVLNEVAQRGLDILSPTPRGDYAEFRIIELGAAANRLRTLSARRRV